MSDRPEALEKAAKEYEATKWRVIEGRASVQEAQGFIDFLEGAIPARSSGLAPDKERDELQHRLRQATAILEQVEPKGAIRNHATGRRELSPPISDETRFAARSWLAGYAGFWPALSVQEEEATA